MSMEHATPTGKDTIYVDVDDEITTLIDKVRSSQARIVALVLPKRAAVLQSVVNMKLLKHGADNAKKHLVLITTDPGILPLAGSIGLYVAKTLQSKPEIPPAPELSDAARDTAEEDVAHLDDEQPAKTKPVKSSSRAGGMAAMPVGELAAKAALPEADLDDALELDDELAEAGEDMPSNSAAKKNSKGKKDKKLSVPNFDKFRLLLVAGGLAFVGLIVLFIVCTKVLPKAVVTIRTNRQSVNISPTLVLDTAAKTIDASKGTVPATLQQTQKTLTGQVNTTGQINNGTKATGSVSVSGGTCSGTPPSSVPAGSGLSANNLTFITQSTVSFVPVLQQHNTKCVFQGETTSGSTSIAVTAQTGGVAYNLPSGTSFTISGRSDVTATSSAAMTGGTDSIIQVVASADIDAAKAKFDQIDTDAIKQQLANNLKAVGSFPILASFTAGTPAITTSANVGDQAATVTATEQISFTMLGAKQSDLEQIVKTAVGKQVDLTKQTIADYGVDGASFTQQGGNGSTMTFSLSDTAIVGAQLDADALKKAIAGKKTPEATAAIQSHPGVTSVDIKYSPFWVGSVPHNSSKITIQIEKPQTTTNND